MSTTIPLPIAADHRRPSELFARPWAVLPPVPAPTPSTPLLASARRLLRDVWAGWCERRLRSATRRALLQLDDRTLRDIGVVRAEVESLAAEAHGGVGATRARLLRQQAMPMA